MQHQTLYPEFHIEGPGQHEHALRVDRQGAAQISTPSCRAQLHFNPLRNGMILGDLSIRTAHPCRLSVTSRGLRAYTSGLFPLPPLSQGCQLLSASLAPAPLSTSSSTILYVPGSKISLSVPASGDIHLVYYSIPNRRLRELLSSTNTYGKLTSLLERGMASRPLLLSSVMVPEMRELLMSIRHCRYEGGAKNLYLEGQLIELLALQLSFLERRKKYRGESRLSSREVERIRKICRHMTQRIDAPPTLDELAHMASMNRNKLNAAFHELFGLSVFQWLRNERLEMAKTHLQHSNTPLTDIADMLGYSSGSNFSHAFKNHFGISPRVYREQQGKSPGT